MSENDEKMGAQGQSIDAGLQSTVDNFASRMQRRIREQQQERERSEELAKARRELLLKAMTSIRRSLQDAHKINLGDRCSYELTVSDWEGWPKIELLLRDSLTPSSPIQGLAVSVAETSDSGRIVFRTIDHQHLGVFDIATDELQKLPLLLRRIVRDFLDTTSAYVLDPPPAEELLEQQTKMIELEGEQINFSDKYSSEEFYLETLSSSADNLVETEEPTSINTEIKVAKLS